MEECAGGLLGCHRPAPVIDPPHRPSGMCARSVNVDASLRCSLAVVILGPGDGWDDGQVEEAQS